MRYVGFNRGGGSGLAIGPMWGGLIVAIASAACLDARTGSRRGEAAANDETLAGEPTDPVCAPTALPYRTAYIPELPPEVMDRVCPLAAEVSDVSGSDARHYVNRISYTWSGNTLTVEGGSLPKRYVFTPDGALIHYEQTLYPDHPGDPSGAIVAYDLTPDGRITSVQHGLPGAVVELVAQEWSADGKLLSRRERYPAEVADAPLGPLAEIVTDWSYDDTGRLISARATIDTHHAEVHWTYDGDRPTRVIRTRDDVVVEDQRWTWSARGELLQREITRDASETYFRPAYPYRSYVLGGPGFRPLDDVAIDAAADLWRTNPWHSAPVRAKGDACRPLPTGFGHGYPATESAYDLGWPVDARPEGIGFAYGASTYGYELGDLSWFGHEAADGGQGRFSADLVYSGKGHALLEYEHGHMVRQALESDGPENLATTRERVFEVDPTRPGARRLVTDRLSWTLGDGDETGARDLVLAYGDDGRLAKRELFDDAAGLIAFQTWDWDDAGRIVAHAVTRAWKAYEVGAENATAFGTLATVQRYARAFDAEGRMVRDTEVRVRPSGAEATTERAWVFEGELLMSAADGDDVSRYFYDDAKRLVLEEYYSARAADPAHPDGTTRYTYDDEGRLVQKDDRLTGSSPWVSVETREFECMTAR